MRGARFWIGNPTVTPGEATAAADLFLNPFNAASAHHRPVGSGAQFAGDTHATTIALNQENFTGLNVGLPSGVYFVKNAPTDPLRTINWSGTGTGAGLPYPNLRVPSELFTLGASGQTQIVLIYDSETSMIHEFRGWFGNAGAPQALVRFSVDPSARGHNSVTVGTSATGMSRLIGMQRGHELNSESFGPIRHVMQLNANNSGSTQKFANSYLWPAIQKGSSCNGTTICISAIPYGALFALPSSRFTDTFINSMGLSALGKRLAVQLRDYGAYLTDYAIGSPGPSDQSVTVDAEYLTQMQIIYPNLRWVMNNSEVDSCSGGGTPIAINNAYDSPDAPVPPPPELRFAPIGYTVYYTSGTQVVTSEPPNSDTITPTGFSVTIAYTAPELPATGTPITISLATRVEWVSTGLRGTALNAPASLPLPTTWSPGNLFIAPVLFSSPSGSVDTPNGWTLLYQLGNADGDLYIFSRFAQGGDTDQTFTVTGGASADAILGGIIAFSGVDQSNPIAAVGPDTVTTSPVNNIAVSAADASGITFSEVLVVGARNAGYVSAVPLTGDGQTWREVMDFSEGVKGAYLVADVTSWSLVPPTLTDKTFILTAPAGTTYGKMLVFNPAVSHLIVVQFGSLTIYNETNRPATGFAVPIGIGAASVVGDFTQFKRGFYQVSYGPNDSVGAANNAQIAEIVSQVDRSSHVIVTLHLRTPSNTSNTVSRGPISEDAANIAAWFQQIRDNGLTPAMAIIMHVVDWDWAGYWNPSDKTTALANYYSSIRPWVQAAEANSAEFLILTDEWSTLYSQVTSITPFTTLFTSARADYSGPIGINLSNSEEADVRPEIVALCDYIGVNAYVPSAVTDSPTVASMKQNLIGTSTVPEVQYLVSSWKTTWNDSSVVGYMTYIKHLAEIEWQKDIIMTVGYQSTKGAARNPSSQPITTVDTAIQANAWQAFLEAMNDPVAGVGSRNTGIFGWMWWPGARFEDDNGQGFTPQGKPAATRIGDTW